MLLALSAAAFGAAFGLRFTGFAALPAIGSALAVAGLGWFSGDDTFGSLMSKLVLLVTCLQLGYLGGAALRFSIKSKNPLSKTHFKCVGIALISIGLAEDSGEGLLHTA